MTLTVPRSTLAAGVRYLFTLSAHYTQGVITSQASYSVVVNSPPHAGTVDASPSTGVALATVFVLSTVGWQDAEQVCGTCRH